MSEQCVDGIPFNLCFTVTLPDVNNCPTIESSSCHTIEKHMKVVGIASVFGKLDNVIAKHNGSIPSLSGVGGNKIVCTLWAVCFPLLWCPYSSGLSSCFSIFFLLIILFILLYSYIHILSDWANCSCSCILCRFNYTPLWASWRTNEGGKKGMCAESVGEWVNEKVKSEKGLEKVVEKRG